MEHEGGGAVPPPGPRGGPVKESAFRLARTAGGRIPTPRKGEEVFPVTVRKGMVTMLVRAAHDDKACVPVATMLPEGVAKTEKVLAARGRKRGKHYRFTTRKVS